METTPETAGTAGIPYVWHRILGEYAAGAIDAEDVWNAVDEFGAGRLPELGDVPVRRVDLADAEEAALVQEQAARLHVLLGRFVAGAMTSDDLASEAMDVLGLAPDDEREPEGFVGDD